MAVTHRPAEAFLVEKGFAAEQRSMLAICDYGPLNATLDGWAYL
jgi:hypothetical protein